MDSCIIALDIGGTFLKSCLFTEEGTLIPDSFDREAVDSNGELPEVKAAYQRLALRLKEQAERRGFFVSALAADTPGPFDFKAAVSRMQHKYTALYGIPLRPWFQEILGEVPVCFLHDSSAFLAGAASAHPEIRNLAGVMIGTGLGFALIRDGELLQNESGGPARSIYRTPYRGLTAEDFVSGRGIRNRYNEISETPAFDAKEVADRALSGDSKALRVFEETGEILAEVIAPILKEFGTEALCLGGQISKSFALMEGGLRKGLKDVPSLRLVEAAEDLDLVHLKGVTQWYLKKKTYPMKLGAVLKDILWGGTKLGERYHKPAGKIAEAWELSVHPEGTSTVENGIFAGQSLSSVLGSTDFPVMIKLIDAEDRLSIQVHPKKTEMWVILEAKPGAALVYGLKKPFDEETFRKALADGTVEELLNFVPVRPGDVFFIPQGLVHAIGAGILIAEIQENSNVTYRVYDYGRIKDGKPRELHVEAAMKTIRDFTEEEIRAKRFETGPEGPKTLADCPYFKVDRVSVDGLYEIPAHPGFTSVVCIRGEGTIGSEAIEQGDSFYLPEGLGAVGLKGRMEVLLTTFV
ncbi:MAG: ROK family protein [Lachnospiraceae bacterium]|nr:ROK family protein [Lachnospiraceae bacterium]